MKKDIHTVTNCHHVHYLASRVMRYDQMMGSKPSTISVLGRKCVFQYNSLKIAWDIEYRIVYERIDYCGHLRIGWGKIAHFDRENRLKRIYWWSFMDNLSHDIPMRFSLLLFQNRSGQKMTEGLWIRKLIRSFNFGLSGCKHLHIGITNFHASIQVNI